MQKTGKNGYLLWKVKVGKIISLYFFKILKFETMNFLN